MRSLGRLLLLAVLAVALVALARFRPVGGKQVYVPEGYVKEVNGWIDEGKLVYDCSRRRIETAALSSVDDFFFDNSYLEDDVAAWNAGDQRPFVVEHEDRRGGGCDGRIRAVNAGYHRQRLPGYAAEQWEGSLYQRPLPGSTVLTSSERAIEVVPAPWRMLPLPAKAFEDVWFRPDSPGIRSPKLAFKYLEQGRAFATLKNVGDNAALEILSERPSLSLNACPVPLGWRVRLDTGDYIRARFENRFDESYVVDSGQGSGLISFVAEVNGTLQRKAYPDRLEMAQEISWAIDTVVRAAADTEGAPGRKDFDVHLTLDPFLGDRVERELSDHCARRYGGRPLRAGVSVVEPESGRVLALASYPNRTDLARLGLREETEKNLRELLRRNHNFMRHAVGSATKPFLAAAALDLHPRLATLRIPCFPEGTPPEDLLGYPMGTYNLPADCRQSVQETIDLERFLTVSSNRYMLYLGFLALAEWDNQGPLPLRGAKPLPPSERYEVGGRAYDSKPRLPISRQEEGSVRSAELQEVGDRPFFKRFRDLFGQSIVYRREGLVEGLDLSYWQPVIDQTLGDLTDPANVSFSVVSPEEVNLRANLIQQLRQDLYTLLLGTGNNRWSNLQMAEAMGRLLTGRAVESRLIEKVTVPAEEPGLEPTVLWEADPSVEAPEWSLDRRLRERLLAGMESVVESSLGTAHLLKPALDSINARVPKGVRYVARAKTGTPTTELGAVERGPTTHNPGAVRRYPGGLQVESAMLVLSISREVAGSSAEHLALAFYVEGQGGSEEAVLLAREVLEPLVNARWPEDFLDAAP